MLLYHWILPFILVYSTNEHTPDGTQPTTNCYGTVWYIVINALEVICPDD
jgi:hypothetical protein